MIFRREEKSFCRKPPRPSRQGVSFLARKKRASRKKSSSKLTGLFLGLIVLLLFVASSYFNLFKSVEQKTMDLHFKVKDRLTYMNRGVNKGIQTGAVKSDRALGISDDIILIGIDNETLADYGRWPFPRSVHTDILDAMSRISDQNKRESAVLLDFLFFDVGNAAYEDVMLLDSMKENGNVLLQTQLYNYSLGVEADAAGIRRFDSLTDQAGQIENVSGEFGTIKRWYGIEAPLIPYTEAISSYGYATYVPDNDDIFRRLQLVSVYSEKTGSYRIEDLKEGMDFQTGSYGHLSYIHEYGVIPVHPLPLESGELGLLTEDVYRHGVEENAGQGDYFVSAYTDHFLPATALSLALDYFNRDLEDIEVVLGSHILIPSPMKRNSENGDWGPYTVPSGRNGRERIVEEIRIPIDENGSMIINYMGGRSSTSPEFVSTYTVRSFTKVADFKPGANQEDWRRTLGWDSKVIMVGAFTKAMADDEKTTPLGLMFGVEMQANALNTIIMDNFVLESPFWADMILIILMTGLVIILVSQTRKLGWSAVALALIIFVSFIIVTLLFANLNFLLDWFTPTIASLTAFLVIVIYRVLSAERDKRQIKNVFGQFISPTIVEKLTSTNTMPPLGGVNRDVTVFFSDIRDFSGLSEKKDNPQELVSLLNEYLTDMTDNIVINFDGTLDKYIGDAIMAIWGAPQDMTPEEHAILACKSALMQIDLLEKMNIRLEERCSEDEVADNLAIGIGIHSGTCMVGYMGSEGRKNYTAMGDTVNLASRLEGVNKVYSTRIIISEETRSRIVSEPFIVRELDRIRVKGRFTPETIYELVDYEGELYTAPEKTGKAG